MEEAIVIENLRKSFNGVEALAGVSHKVPRGEVHVLLGPNGSGKSTLMRICAVVLMPDSGRVLVFDREPYRDFNAKLRMGYAPQDALLYEELTGLENMYFYAGLQGVAEARSAGSTRRSKTGSSWASGSRKERLRPTLGVWSVGPA